MKTAKECRKAAILCTTKRIELECDAAIDDGRCQCTIQGLDPALLDELSKFYQSLDFKTEKQSGMFIIKWQ